MIKIPISATGIVPAGLPMRRELIKYIVMIIAFWILLYAGNILLVIYSFKGRLGPNNP